MQEQTTQIIPHLTCRNAPAAIEFYQRAFGAEVPFTMPTPDGRILHACVTIDGAPFYLVEEFADCGGTSPQALGGSPVTIHLRVANCDAVFDRAVAAGATVAMPLEDQFWGDRYGLLVDPFGHRWSVATTKRVVEIGEMERALAGGGLNVGEVAVPPVASREEWLAARKRLLEREKAHTREYDAVNAERRRLPMVAVEKAYAFDAPDRKASLLDLFESRRQLIVYHFMFDPAWDKGCDGCTGFVDALGDLSMLPQRNTTFTLVSRAPLEKLLKYRAERRWDRTWVSSLGSDFNFDFHATLDEDHREYNYREEKDFRGEAHGISVFFRDGDRAFHTYSSYARGVESTIDSYRLLDLTPYGRQEEFEDSPAGWPQRPTYG